MNQSTDAVEKLRADYDATPYNSDAFPQSAPGQLAAIAHVWSMRLDEPLRRKAELTRSDGEGSIFNLWHETLILSPVDRQLLRLLDGTRDRDTLLQALLSIDRASPMGIDREAMADHVDGLPERLTELKPLRVR